MMILRILLLLAGLVTAGNSNWPQFRGPGASGLGVGAPPEKWNGEAGENILWKAEIPGLAHSSPVIWGDRIFLTSAVAQKGDGGLKLGLYGDIGSVEHEGEHAFNVYCLNRRTGKILWQRTAVRTQPNIKRHPKSTHANPTPATDGKHLVAFFGSEGLHAYDMNGNLRWKKDLGTLDAGFFRVPAAQWGFASSPIIHAGMVIVQADVQQNSFLAAFDVRTGNELWRTPRKDVPTFGTPSIAPYTGGGGIREQVVVNGWKQIAGYDLKSGKQLWTLTGGGDIPVPTPVHDGALIVITSAHGSSRPIYAIRTDAAGDITGKRESLAWSHDRAGNYMQTPLLHGGLGYFVMDNGVLSVYELKSGERLYQQRLGGGTAGFSGSPVAAANRIYITNEDGKSYVLASGRTYTPLAENELGETVMSTPAIAGGVLYIRGRKHLFAVGNKSK